MNILEYIEFLDIDLQASYYHKQNMFTVWFEGCELKEGRSLSTIHGNGGTFEDAVEDYLIKIRGNMLVKNAMSIEYRRAFIVPLKITGIPKKGVKNGD